MTDRGRSETPVPFPWQRLLGIATVFIVVVAALWQVIGAFDDTGVDPRRFTPPASPGATEIVPTVLATPTEPIATPNIEPEWPAGSLPALLNLAPNRLADGSLPLDSIATYADIARWTASRGLATPASPGDPATTAWFDALAILAVPDTLREHGLDPAWESAYGFNLFDVQQVLQIGQAPDYVLIMRGTWDAAALQDAWVSSGYQPVEVDGVTAWSLTPGDTIDLSPAASRPAMGSLNNIVLLDDGTLVGTARTSRLGDTLRAIQGRDDSLADDDAIAPFLSPDTGIEDIATAVLSQGSLLQGVQPGDVPDVRATPGSATPAATPDANDAMPPVRAVLVGLPLPSDAGVATPVTGETQPVTIMLAMDDLDSALAGRNWIEFRYPDLVSPVTGAAYAERYGDIEIRVIGPSPDDAPAAIVIGGTLGRGAADWLAIVVDRDLGFAAWTPEEEP